MRSCVADEPTSLFSEDDPLLTRSSLARELRSLGVPISDSPMDFSAWFEVYLGGQWYTFDARHNKPRIGRILMARGRDATDVALSTTFGPSRLADFRVVTDEVIG